MGIQCQVHNNRKLILPGYAGYTQTKASIPQLQKHQVSYDCKLTHYLLNLVQPQVEGEGRVKNMYIYIYIEKKTLKQSQ